jgi:hypothetical protein
MLITLPLSNNIFVEHSILDSPSDFSYKFSKPYFICAWMSDVR